MLTAHCRKSNRGKVIKKGTKKYTSAGERGYDGADCGHVEATIIVDLYCFLWDGDRSLMNVFVIAFCTNCCWGLLWPSTRVSNLSENVKEDDIVSLFKNCGNIARIFLAKDKTTGKCKVRFGQVPLLRPLVTRLSGCHPCQSGPSQSISRYSNPY